MYRPTAAGRHYMGCNSPLYIQVAETTDPGRSSRNIILCTFVNRTILH